MTTTPMPPAGPDRSLDHDLDRDLAVRRWRMVLGRYAESALPRGPGDAGLDDVLSYLYDREYTERGHLLGGVAGPAQQVGPDAAAAWAPRPSGPSTGSTAPAASSPTPPSSASRATP